MISAHGGNLKGRVSRREAATFCSALAAGAPFLAPGLRAPAWAQAAEAEKIKQRPIPHSGEALPVVGVGTMIVFDAGADQTKRSNCSDTMRAMVSHGGSVVDTSESYGSAEIVVGDIVAELGLRSQLFLATKMDAKDYNANNGAAAFQGSLERLRTSKLDLMQFHNVRDPNQDLSLLRDWKAQGLCRYIGITTTSQASYDAAVSILEREKPDFLMVDYAIDKRESALRVLPAAAQVGAATIIALPFGRGRVFREVLSKPLPDWVAEFDCKSWAQFFLKYILANSAVTVVAPGTDKASHMIDNLGAGLGRLPDLSMCKRMEQYIEVL